MFSQMPGQRDQRSVNKTRKERNFSIDKDRVSKVSPKVPMEKRLAGDSGGRDS